MPGRKLVDPRRLIILRSGVRSRSEAGSITKIAIFCYQRYSGPKVYSMNVSLTKELEELILEKVESGLYTSASEVIREALRLMEEQDQLKKKRLAEVGRKIDRGVAQLDRGEGISSSQIRSKLRRTKNK